MSVSFNRVAKTFWSDRKIRELDSDGRLLALYLLTCEARGSEGFFRLSPALAADELAWDTDRLATAVEALREVEFATFDLAAHVVLIHRGLKYNPPNRSDQQVTGALKQLDRTHGAPDLFRVFLAGADTYAPHLASAIRAHYGIAEGAASKPLSSLRDGDGARDGDGYGDGDGYRDGYGIRDKEEGDGGR